MPMNKQELKELQQVPDSTVIFEDSIDQDINLREVPDEPEQRKQELEQRLQQRLADPEWGANFKGGKEAINLNGRPRIPQLSKMTNKQIRTKELLNLCRKVKPYQTKAIQAIVKILDDPESSDQNKIKAAVFITEFYKSLIKETFDYRYDEDHAKEVQEDNTPVFSLKMIDSEDK